MPLEPPTPAAADAVASSLPERPRAETDWRTFVDAFGPVTLGWFRRAGLADADACELARAIMQSLGQQFAENANDPSLRFRAWLQFAAHNSWCHLMEGLMETIPEGTNPPKLAVLLSLESHDAFLAALDSECGHGRRREAIARAQPRVDSTDWEIFSHVVLEDRNAAELATLLRCKELAIRAAVFRVQRALNEELKIAEEMF